MKYWNSSNGRIELFLELGDAKCGSHQGDCGDDIDALRGVPYIKAQLATIRAEDLVSELAEYGAWETSDLIDHELNLDRILWIACGDILEEERTAQP